MANDTIFALATGAGRAAIAVMRISGPATGATLMALCGDVPPARRAVVRGLRGTDGLLDRAMVLWLPGPGSYTGEDSAELHLHCSRAVIAAVADRLVSLDLRPADPGEFTRRGFLNGRMDLTEAEAVHDLVSAETDAQRRQALRQLDGALGAIYRRWSDQLREALAHQEALIDFPDEDLPPEVDAALTATIERLRHEITNHLNDGSRGEKLREGLFFAIIGPANVGKSSLINALAGREVAIVSPTPGTTRDVLEARVELGGVPVTLADTAGLRDTQDLIEAEGVRRALRRAEDADLVICLTAMDDPMSEVPYVQASNAILITNKSDLGSVAPAGALSISALTGAGIPALRERLGAIAHDLTQRDGPPPLTRQRHRVALEIGARHLAAAHAADLPELRGEDLRLALRALGRITGQVGVEDILDTLFAHFCIGK